MGADGATLLGNHGHHRRRLALLAVLAAAGEQGRSRDHLLLLFWPDATQARARHSLDQLLYALRSSHGESLFIGVNPVRLNSAAMSSDVAEFNDALARGHLAAAVDLYRGAFLDGFYVNDAPEFERWTETERLRLAASCTRALERLAREAAAAGAHSTALQRWQQLVSLDPLSSRNAVGFLEALRDAGDPTAALQFARRYEALVTQELGSGIDASVASLVASLRVAAPPAAPVPRSHFSPSLDDAAIATSSRRPRGPWMRSVVAGLLALAAITSTIVWRREVRTRGPLVDARPSVVVLPLTSAGAAPEDAALVDGFTEELIAMLGRLGDLRVIGSTSAFEFRGSTLGTRRIADSLGVANILEGTAQREGDRLRLELRLLSATNGTTRWTRSYDRNLADIFSVQGEIAAEVARALDVRSDTRRLPRAVAHGTRNVAAYEEYLRGNDPAVTRSDSAADAGLGHFRRAVSLDSTYAAAYAGMARMYMRSPSIDGRRIPMRVRQDSAMRAARRAVALDGSLAEAHAALGLQRKMQYDFSGAETELRHAAALDPDDARVREWLVQLDVVLERTDDALEQGRRAVTLDPLSPTANAELANALLGADRCDDALAVLARLQGLTPPLLRATSIAVQCRARLGQWNRALALLQPARDTSTRSRAVAAYLLARSGRVVDARRILGRLLDQRGADGGTAFDIGLVYTGLGDNDQAFTWLDRSVQDQSFTLEWLPTLAERLHHDPRFTQLRHRLGIPNR